MQAHIIWLLFFRGKKFKHVHRFFKPLSLANRIVARLKNEKKKKKLSSWKKSGRIISIQRSKSTKLISEQSFLAEVCIQVA